MKLATGLLLPLLAASAVACSGPRTASDASTSVIGNESTTQVVTVSEVEWEALNPARGDQSPQAGTLWGDRGGSGATGFLLAPTDGFRSPPHIHNVSYRGIVIRGLIHNDDPTAGDMWMPAGSFWTQPRGGVHVTAAEGHDTLAYIEIEEGPYLVLPMEDEFHAGEVPINVDESNIVWLDASDIAWLDERGEAAGADGAGVAFLWGDPRDGELNGTLVRLPAGFNGAIRSRGASFRAVVIEGRPSLRTPGEADLRVLEPGSYVGSTGAASHQLRCEAGEPCVLYVRMDGRFDIVSTKPAQ